MKTSLAVAVLLLGAMLCTGASTPANHLSISVNPRTRHSNLLLTMAQKMRMRIDRLNNSGGSIADVVR